MYVHFELFYRKFFKHYEKVAGYLGVPTWLIKDLGTIWTTLKSGLIIDTDKFAEFCNEFRKKFESSQFRSK